MTVDSLLSNINNLIVNPLIFLLFGVALVVFLWGVAQFIINADSSEGRKLGRDRIIYGIIGMFIMVSVYGILSIITHTFHIDTSNTLDAVKRN